MNLKVLNKKISTKDEGVFYKEVINEKYTVVDKIYLIRYRENYSDKQMTIGKFDLIVSMRNVFIFKIGIFYVFKILILEN